MADKATSTEIVVDATSSIAGRLASMVAKMLLEGKKVAIVNAESALISGRRSTVITEMLKRLEISSIVNPRHGPFHPRAPDRILTKIVRGMLPWRRPKGKEAMRRLRVYVGVPDRYAKREKRKLEETLARKTLSYYVSLSDLGTSVGWRSKAS